MIRKSSGQSRPRQRDGKEDKYIAFFFFFKEDGFRFSVHYTHNDLTFLRLANFALVM